MNSLRVELYDATKNSFFISRTQGNITPFSVHACEGGSLAMFVMLTAMKQLHVARAQ